MSSSQNSFFTKRNFPTLPTEELIELEKKANEIYDQHVDDSDSNKILFIDTEQYPWNRTLQPAIRLLQDNIVTEVVIQGGFELEEKSFFDFLQNALAQTTSVVNLMFNRFNFGYSVAKSVMHLQHVMNALLVNQSVTGLEFRKCQLLEEHQYIIGRFLEIKDTTLMTLKIEDRRLGLMNEIFDRLPKNNTLQSLELAGQLSVSRLAKFLKDRNSISVLRSLVLVESKFDDEDIHRLAKSLAYHKSIKEFKLIENPLEIDGAQSIGTMLMESKNLESVALLGNQLETPQLLAIAMGLSKNKGVREFRISNFEYSDEKEQKNSRGPLALLRAIQNQGRINVLFFDIPIEGTTVDHFCEFLDKNQSVTDLTITYVPDEADLHKILDCFSANNRLIRHLNLRGVKLGTEGAAKFSNLLENDQTLQKVNLSSCHITPLGAMLLSNALKVNNTLNVLDLSYNDLDTRSYMNFLQNLRTNKSLISIDFPKPQNRFVEMVQDSIKVMLDENLAAQMKASGAKRRRSLW